MMIRCFKVRFMAALLAVLSAGPQLARGQSVDQLDPADFLPPPEEIPEDFAHQAQYDRVLVEAGVVRIFRFYTRGAPELPTDEHASILLVMALCESPQQAVIDFQETVVSWSRIGYRLYPLEAAVGEEAFVGWTTFFEGTDHLKQGFLLQFRLGSGHATVQWTDDPGQPVVEDALTIGRLIEVRLATPNRLLAEAAADPSPDPPGPAGDVPISA